MLTLSSDTTSPSTWPCRMSDGASRKYRPLSGYVDSVFDVLAGENMITPALVTLSMTFSVTADDAAPMMASTPCAELTVDRLRADRRVLRVARVALRRPSTSLPSAPPAALMSLTARRTPEISGGPRDARLPVTGRNVPTFSAPSPARVPWTGTSGTSAAVGAFAVLNTVFESSILSWALYCSTP